MQRISRRQVLRGSVGFGVGAFAVGRAMAAGAQQATPASSVPAVQPLGFVSLRLRQLSAPELVPEIDQIVVSEFVPTVQALPGYLGYLLGDVVEDRRQNLVITVLEQESDNAGFEDAAQTFVGGLDPKYVPETPLAVKGDLLIAAPSAAQSATPAASPVASPGATGGYAAVRMHTSKPGTDPLDLAPRVIAEFLPVIATLPGFNGYLWFLNEGGFTAVSLYDNPASAQASTAAVQESAAELAAAFTDNNPRVINAEVVFADLPVLTRSTG